MQETVHRSLAGLATSKVCRFSGQATLFDSAVKVESGIACGRSEHSQKYYVSFLLQRHNKFLRPSVILT